MHKDVSGRSCAVAIAAVLIALVVGIGNAAAQELLVNPGFEDGVLTPWTIDANWAIGTTNCYSGAYCAGTTGNFYIQQTFAPVPTAQITSFTFWIRQVATNPAAAIQLNYSDTSSEQPLIYPTSTWTQFDMTAELDAGKSLTSIRIYGNSSGATFLDDVSLQGTREAPVIPVLGWQGLLTLAALLALAGAALARQRLA
jgi:hypothetical protein